MSWCGWFHDQGRQRGTRRESAESAGTGASRERSDRTAAPNRQSTLLAGVIVATCVIVAFFSATRPGEWLEYSPLLTLVVVALTGSWAVQQFADQDPIVAISGLNTDNLLFLTLGLLLHWRPRHFLAAVTQAVPAIDGVLIQFPFYAGIAAIMTKAVNHDGHSLANYLASAFTSISSPDCSRCSSVVIRSSWASSFPPATENGSSRHPMSCNPPPT